jgi:hypothetical protein
MGKKWAKTWSRLGGRSHGLVNQAGKKSFLGPGEKKIRPFCFGATFLLVFNYLSLFFIPAGGGR